jgi:hypothetical protein
MPPQMAHMFNYVKKLNQVDSTNRIKGIIHYANAWLNFLKKFEVNLMH